MKIFLFLMICHSALYAQTNDTKAVNQVQTNKTYCSYYNDGDTNSFTAWMDKKLVLAQSYTPEGLLTNTVVNGTGIIREFYDSGTNKMSCSFVKGQPDGLKTIWYPNGQIKSKHQFLAGKRNGKWVQYYSDGSMQSEILYSNNRQLTKKFWDKSGKLILDHDFRKKK